MKVHNNSFTRQGACFRFSSSRSVCIHACLWQTVMTFMQICIENLQHHDILIFFLCSFFSVDSKICLSNYLLAMTTINIIFVALIKTSFVVWFFEDRNIFCFKINCKW